jgi:uncharacterized phiE125 gp8 family phage protein
MTAVIVPPALTAAAAEAKTYLRVAGAGEDALIERLVASACGLCEAFTGRWLLARQGTETIFAGGSWQRLSATPVRAILGAEGVPAEGAPFALAAGAFAIDIDAHGDGWVRIIDAAPARRVRVQFEAGMAADWAGVPEPLRQGIVRLTAHLFTHRSDAREGAPPAAVTALWRPWRRLPFGFPPVAAAALAG